MKATIITVVISGLLFFGLYKLREYTINHTIKVKATVLSHPNITSDKYGDVDYRTLVRTEDGYVEEIKGVSYYVLPINTVITISVFRE